jgi:hypothetical protein
LKIRCQEGLEGTPSLAMTASTVGTRFFLTAARGSPRPPGSQLATRGGGPVGTGPGGPALRPLDGTQVLIGRVVLARESWSRGRGVVASGKLQELSL